MNDSVSFSVVPFTRPTLLLVYFGLEKWELSELTAAVSEDNFGPIFLSALEVLH